MGIIEKNMETTGTGIMGLHRGYSLAFKGENNLYEGLRTLYRT